MKRVVLICAVLVLVAESAPARLFAQSGPRRSDRGSEVWAGEITFAALNTLIGAVSGGVLQKVRKDSFSDGFVRGALGGAVTHAGRRLVVEDFAGSGLLGRQVAAVGASMVRNAGAADPLLANVWLPVGPLLLHVRTEESFRIRPIVDLLAVGWITAAVFEDRLELEARATLSSGAPVFRATGHRLNGDDGALNGFVAGGLIFLSAGVPTGDDGETLAHERVHVLQYDYAQLVWGDAVEGYGLGKVPYGAQAATFVRPGFVFPLFHNLLDVIDPRLTELWEVEAYFLDDR